MGKGAQTRNVIVERAMRLASRDGLEGLSVGLLAAELGISKSGLFSHFGSKDELQLQVLQAAVDRFREVVVRPALKAPRGAPRIRAMFNNWLAWSNDPSLPGGCIIVAAASELDDRPGAQRDFLVSAQRDWFATLAKAARLTVENGDFREDLDPEQFAFDAYGIILAYHHARRLLRDKKAEARARASFEGLINAARS
ncbi:MAG TPA: TetR/AcrR family transcriptional regulator [Polyangia bacterium]|nr:TetR/AcrR family transcriptional regulator [Polyangia bacterium]